MNAGGIIEERYLIERVKASRAFAEIAAAPPLYGLRGSVHHTRI
jgi:hypothetical protein